jgi:hypothetical protein
MSRIAELQLSPQISVAIIFFVPIEQHINLFYTGLAIVFICFMAYMFIYSKRH